MGEISPSSDAEPGAGAPGTAQRAAAKPIGWGVVTLAGVAIVALGAVIATTILVSRPRPDATLRPSGVEPDNQLITMLEGERPYPGFVPPPGYGSEALIDLSTLRGFETYQGLELWSATNAFESTCLIAVHRPTVDIVSRQCVPAGVDLFIDPVGAAVRFFLRGDAVHAYLLVPEAVD